MWYDVDMVKMAQLLLPPFLRKPRLFALLRVLIVPLGELHERFMQYRSQSMNRLVITGQVISMEKNLNGMFYLEHNEIYITDVPAESITLYNDEEAFPGVVMYNDGEESPDQVIWRNDGEGQYDGDFIVNVPSFLSEYENQIRIFLDTYKVVGRKYILNIYEYE